jgi:hypothetical protein
MHRRLRHRLYLPLAPQRLTHGARAVSVCRPQTPSNYWLFLAERDLFRHRKIVPLAGAQGNDKPAPIPFADEGGTSAYRTNQATSRIFSRTPLLDLVLPARRCRTAARAGVLGSGVVAGLNVLPRRHFAETHLTIALVTAIGTWVI